MLREILASRELIIQLTARDLRIRYKQAIMGLAWSVLIPGLVILAGAVVRLVMAQIGGTAASRTGFALVTVKAVPWAFFIGALSFATTSLTSNATLVSKVYFPRQVLPFSAVVTQLVDSSIGAVFVVVLLPFLGAALTPSLLWVPLLCALLFAFTLGAALLLSCANLFFRDVKYLVQAASTFGIFFTPVLFEAQSLGPTGSKLMLLNPLAPLFEGLGLAAVGGHSLLHPLATGGAIAWHPAYLAYSTAWAVAMLLGGAAVFRRSEPLFAEYV